MNVEIKGMPAESKISIGAPVRNFIKSRGSIVIFLVIWILAAILVRNFATLDNSLLIIKQSAIPVIACLGMTMILMTGGIDLSLGYTVGMTSIIAGMLVKTFGVPIWAAVLLTLLVGALLGMFNGVIIQNIKVPAFITTLGTGYIIYGVAQIVSRGNAINRLPDAFNAIGKTEILSLPSTVYIAVFIAVISYFVLHKSVFGRTLMSFGFNERASFLSGVRTGRLNKSVYVITGVLAAVVGILMTIRVNCAQPDMGGGSFTFEVVTAAIVGGTSLFGGIGSVVGSVFGVLIIKMIENCINLMGVSYYLYQAIMGIVILGAIIFENVKNKSM
jgi:ribose/xylose/arabinose/galactoside ABC-type transport system permease subunit